jgi:hypothetical protein
MTLENQEITAVSSLSPNGSCFEKHQSLFYKLDYIRIYLYVVSLIIHASRSEYFTFVDRSFLDYFLHHCPFSLLLCPVELS